MRRRMTDKEQEKEEKQEKEEENKNKKKNQFGENFPNVCVDFNYYIMYSQ